MTEANQIILNNIKAVVEDVFECEGKLGALTRERDIVDARFAYSKLTSKYIMGISASAIGRSINRDHASVLNHYKKHEDLFTINDKSYVDRYQACEARVKGFTNFNPVDYREMLQDRLESLSQEKCKSLLTIIEENDNDE